MGRRDLGSPSPTNSMTVDPAQMESRRRGKLPCREQDLPMPVKVTLIGIALIGVPAAAPSMNDVATFAVRLTGQAETDVAHPSGGTGDLSASGWVQISIDAPRKQLCYDLRLRGVSDPMMAHVHEGGPLQNGPPVIILFVGTRPNLKDCVASTHSQLSEIIANPEHYYVSVDSTEFPDGALRGQL
jgi:hypothetical protein